MPLESSATYINSFNPAWPDGADQRSTADDHIRLLKGGILRTFPSITGAVSVDHNALNRTQYLGSLSYSILTGGLIDTTKFTYPQTAAESAASVTPVNSYQSTNTPFYDTRRQGALIDNSTDNTTAVLNSLKAMNGTTTQGGGIVYNPKNSKFNLSSITSGSGAPARFILLYFAGDDTSDSTVVGTNELRWFICNANASGIVNEHHVIESPFNPGAILANVRKNLSMQVPYLGGGQSMTAPARTSVLTQDEDLQTWGITYQNYDTQSNFSGSAMYGMRNTYTLNGITNTSFGGGAAAIGGVVTGNTSGAKGFVDSTDASKTIVIWNSGKFVAGEKVTWNAIASTPTISSATFTATQSTPIAIGQRGRGWGIGLPNDLTDYPLGVGGPIGIQATRTFSQYVGTTYASPYYELVDSYENSPPNGFQLFYSTVPAAASRRVTLRKYNTTTDIGHIGAVRAYCVFTDGGAITTSAFNVASITKNGTGDYTVNFTNVFTRADFVVTLTPSNGTDYPFVFTQTTGSVRIQVATNGTPGTLRNIGAGGLSVMCVGGDI